MVLVCAELVKPASADFCIHQGVPSASTLTGTDATAQAARAPLAERLARALVVVAYPPQTLVVFVRGALLFGALSQSRMGQAMRVVLAHVAPLFAGRAANDKSHRAISAKALTRTREAAVNLVQRCGGNRHTVIAHVSIIEADL